MRDADQLKALPEQFRDITGSIFREKRGSIVYRHAGHSRQVDGILDYLDYVSRATKLRATVMSAGGATIRDVMNARREGLDPIGLPDANAVIKIEALATTISLAVDEFQARLKSASGK